MSIEILKLDQDKCQDWDYVCINATNAWYWHSRTWINFIIEHEVYEPLNLSAVLYYNNEAVAIIPLLVCNAGGKKVFTLGGWALPIPAMIFQKIPKKQISSVVSSIFAYIDLMAFENEVLIGKFSINTAFYESPWNMISMLPKGYLINYDSTTVVPVNGKSFEEIFMLSRPKYRQIYRKSNENIDYQVCDYRNINNKIVDSWNSIASLDPNQELENLANFFYSVALERKGFFVLGRDIDKKKVISLLFIIIDKEFAFDHEVTVHPDYKSSNLSLFMKFKAIEYLCNNNYKTYDLGIFSKEPMLHRIPDKKKIGITGFKEGFFNKVTPMLFIEKFYSKEHFLIEEKDRLNDFVGEVYDE